MRSLRVLHVLRAPVGGLFRHVCDVAQEQAHLGHAVGVLCDADAADPLTEGRLAALSRHLALGLHRVSMPRDVGPGDWRAARTAISLARRLGTDVLHGHGAKGGAYARMARRWLQSAKQPVAAFYTPHGGSLHYRRGSLKSRLFMGAERLLASATDGIVFESAYAMRTFEAYVGATACAKRVVHNGIAAGELEPVPLDPGATEFLFIGELRDIKGVDVLLDAMHKLRAVHPARLTIVGAGPDDAKLRHLSTRLGLDDAVTFAGAMPARAAMRRGNCLVMPSHAESLPYVALEAAGAGRPLIATSVGGIPEIVDGTDTELVASGNVDDLCRAMLDAVQTPAGAHAKAQRLQARIGAHFSITAMVGAIDAFYADALAARLPGQARPDIGAVALGQRVQP